MLLLNGVFCWFTGLPEFWQTAIVAGALVSLGIAIGSFMNRWFHVPQELDTAVVRVDSLTENQQGVNTFIADQIATNKEFRQTLKEIVTAVDTIKEAVEETKWRVEIMACYRESGDSVPVSRICLEEAR